MKSVNVMRLAGIAIVGMACLMWGWEFWLAPHLREMAGLGFDNFAVNDRIMDIGVAVIGTAVVVLLYDRAFRQYDRLWCDTEAALLAQEARFQSLFDNAPIGIMVRGKQDWHETQFVNGAGLRLLGFDPNETDGFRFRDLVHPDDLVQVRGLRRRLFDGELAHAQMVVRCTRKDGTEIQVRLDHCVVRGDDGRPNEVVTMLQDVTDPREAATPVVDESDSSPRARQALPGLA